MYYIVNGVKCDLFISYAAVISLFICFMGERGLFISYVFFSFSWMVLSLNKFFYNK